MSPARRLDGIEISQIRQINALATPDAIHLGLGEPNLEPDQTLRRLAREVASGDPWHYSPNSGSAALRLAIAEHEGRAIDPDSQICVTAGSQEALYASMQAFIDRGSEVLVPDPGFLAYPTLVRLAGGKPIQYQLAPKGWGLERREIERKWSSKTRAIIVNSPANPTGSVLSCEDVEWISGFAEERGAIVISDEVYREIWFGKAPATFLGAKNALTIRGMSKSHAMTGLRIGWAIGQPELIHPVTTVHQYITTCASVFSQNLAERILGEKEWNENWLNHVRDHFQARRDTLTRAIESQLGMSIERPEGAFYGFVPVPENDSVSLCRRLATEAGVVVIPGAAFGAHGESHVRISFAAEPDSIREGVSRLGAFLRTGR